MKLFSWGKDGGKASTVWGLWFVEIKSLFSIVLLKFENGTRDAYHDHSFNCISWVLRGKLIENHLNGAVETHKQSLWPIVTRRETFHKVESVGTTWVISFRGPWANRWHEYLPNEDRKVTLTHGRKEVDEHA